MPANFTAHWRNSYQEETNHQLVVPPVYQPGTQNHPIQLESFAIMRQLAAIFSQPPLIAYKCNTNIRDMLVWSKLCQPATRTPGTTPCNQAKCGTCPFICTYTIVTGPKSQMNIMKQFNCLTYNIVYIIHCTKCAQLYIGENWTHPWHLPQRGPSRH